MKFRTDRSLHEVVILFSFKADLLLESYLIVGKNILFFFQVVWAIVIFYLQPCNYLPSELCPYLNSPHFLGSLIRSVPVLKSSVG